MVLLMLKFFVLMSGLPGSGKSYLAKILAEKHNGYLIDDPTDIDSELSKIPQNKNLIFITDPFFCLEEIQKLAEEKLYGWFPWCGITWIALDNNPQQCRMNVAARNDGRPVEGSIRRFSKEFHFPEGGTPFPCYADEESFRAAADKLEF